uniref:Uncharacterized protein n=1 Tax=Magnetospirillum gryphiswaldense TaxID=55518 RepID=A4U3Q9_9PROT|nr:hypothetical protein MGR_1981 [Magnetospirillum gryphiswaldense MSR-1]
MAGLDHLPPSLDAHRPKALDKKSRSTTSWPIFACNLATSASLAALAASDLPENVAAIPSTA